MAIFTRVTLKEYPGAVTEVRVPFECVNFPTIQQLATDLNSLGQPTTIVNGKIFTEEIEGNIRTACGI